MTILSNPQGESTPTCLRYGGTAGANLCGRCDACHADVLAERSARWRRRMPDPLWWAHSAIRLIHKGYLEEARDAMIESARVLSRRIRSEGGR